MTIGNRVFVGPHACFTNDLYPRADATDWEIVPTKVENGASIGANATILCGLTIGRNAMVAAGAVVVKDVPAHALVAGVPAKLVGWVCDRGHPVDSKNWCARCGKTYAIPRPASRKRAGSRSRGRSKRRTWDLFFRGARLAAVVLHLRTCWQVAATRRAVLSWVRVDSRLLAGYVEPIMAERKVDGGRRWHENLAVVRKGPAPAVRLAPEGPRPSRSVD